MEHKKTFTILAVVFAALLLINTLSIRSLKSENENLRTQIGNMQSSLLTELLSLNSGLNTLKSDIQGELEKEASLLIDGGATLAVEKGMLVVTAHAMPKELKTGETAAFVFRAGTQTQTLPAPEKDGRYTASARMKPWDCVTVTVQFLSDTGIRQETLPEVDVTDTLALYFESNWLRDLPQGNDSYDDPSQYEGDGRLLVTLWPYTGEVNRLYEEIETIQLVIKSAAEGEEENSQELQRMDMTALDPDKLAHYGLGGEFFAGYTGDVSQYLSVDGSFAAFCEITTKGGLGYTLCIAEFERSSGDNGETSSFGNTGSDIAYPEFD